MIKILGIDLGKKFNFFRFATRSPKWSSIRKQHIKNNPCCAACGKCNKVEVHHIEPVHINEDRELDPINLITLCDNPCHIVFGHLMNYKSWNSSVVDDCKSYKSKIDSRP